jgi:hypothetical protein
MSTPILTAARDNPIVSPCRQHATILADDHVGKTLAKKELLHLDAGRSQKWLQPALFCQNGGGHL